MMPTTKVLAPINQFTGSDRQLDHIRGALQTALFQEIRFAVAYAKSGPLERLQLDFITWKSKGEKRTSKIILGIDQKGTSVQALTLALSIFDQVYVTNTASSSTFHPKMYLFRGRELGRAIVGSHNLTVGGTETNFEAGVELDYTLPKEEGDFNSFMVAWDDIVAAPFTKALNEELLQDLLNLGLLLDERTTVSAGAAKKAVIKSAGKAYPFPNITAAPPSALPKTAPSLTGKASVAKKTTAKKSTSKKSAATTGGAIAGSSMPAAATIFSPKSLLIQIVPHDNGEVFLSKTAVNQNPAFFGFPFSGTTTAKKAGKPGYPQRVPDPKVDINVYGSKGKLLLQKSAYQLNTIFYEEKGEIRVTVSPDIRKAIEPFSILHMQPGAGAIDYTMDVYNPGSSLYTALLSSCNQTLPSGGKVARKMGWL